jgi:hypothetical protein
MIQTIWNTNKEEFDKAVNEAERLVIATGKEPWLDLHTTGDRFVCFVVVKDKKPGFR